MARLASSADCFFIHQWQHCDSLISGGAGLIGEREAGLIGESKARLIGELRDQR